MEQLLPLLETFPDALVIQTHRDAVTATVSLASLTAHGRRAYFDAPDAHRVGREMSAGVERLLTAIVRDRARLEPAGARFVDVHFADLMADPFAIVRGIYERGGRALAPAAQEAMRHWQAESG